MSCIHSPVIYHPCTILMYFLLLFSLCSFGHFIFFLHSIFFFSIYSLYAKEHFSKGPWHNASLHIFDFVWLSCIPFFFTLDSLWICTFRAHYLFLNQIFSSISFLYKFFNFINLTSLSLTPSSRLTTINFK